MSSLFVYGTLTFPRVAQAVTGRTFRAAPAELVGYECRTVLGQVHPGAIAAPGKLVRGVLWLDVDDLSLVRIDRFEGPLYKRESISVTRLGGTPGKALVYVVRPQYAGKLGDVIWDPVEFEKKHLDGFLRSLGG